MFWDDQWNRFNEAKSLSMTVESEAERKGLVHLIDKMQEHARRQAGAGHTFEIKFEEVQRLRSEEAKLSKEIVGIERARRESRGAIIFGLVLMNALQVLAIFYLFLNYAVEFKK